MMFDFRMSLVGTFFKIAMRIRVSLVEFQFIISCSIFSCSFTNDETFYAVKKQNTVFLPAQQEFSSWWLGWAMVLVSFQCRGVVLLLHIVGQGPSVLAAGAGQVGYIFFYFSYIFHF